MCSTCSRKVGAVQVAEANGVRAADLVAVAGPDAAAGGADVLAVGGVLVERPIFGEVPGEDHVGAVAEQQVLVARRPCRGAASSSSSSITRGRVEDDAAGDDAGDAGRQNAAGEQRELVDLVADDDRVAGVRAALIADDDVVLAGSAGRRSCPWLRRPIADR